MNYKNTNERGWTLATSTLKLVGNQTVAELNQPTTSEKKFHVFNFLTQREVHF